jgi:hypothetical protein
LAGYGVARRWIAKRQDNKSVGIARGSSRHEQRQAGPLILTSWNSGRGWSSLQSVGGWVLWLPDSFYWRPFGNRRWSAVRSVALIRD